MPDTNSTNFHEWRGTGKGGLSWPEDPVSVGPRFIENWKLEIFNLQLSIEWPTAPQGEAVPLPPSATETRWARGVLWLLLVITFVAAITPAARADCSVTNLGIRPLTDLGIATYKNFLGGLYPNGANNRPPTHLAAGLEIASNQIAPLNAGGQIDRTNGRIVLLSIGMSNTTAEWGNGFEPLANADSSKNPRLVLVDGAQGGQAATDWTNFDSTTWSTVEQRLTAAGVNSNQVE